MKFTLVEVFLVTAYQRNHRLHNIRDAIGERMMSLEFHDLHPSTEE
jgi:hypothetical protein